ncbi:MAG: hypothetical protein QM662_02385 [Gordonia sp. (in: high G+C Gram-positive bacteria)]
MKHPTRGRWIPLLPSLPRRIAMDILCLFPIGVGADYLTGSDNASSLSELERSLPLPVWGWLLVAAGTVAIVGQIGRWRLAAIWGLLWSGGLMMAVGVGIGWVTVPQTGTFRTALLYVGIGVVGWVCALGYATQKDEPPRGP